MESNTMTRSLALAHYVATLALPLLAVAASHAAEPIAPTAAARLLLEKGWGKTAAARALVDAPSLDAPPLAGDPVVLFARWLVFMHQGRYDDALPSVQAFVKA